MRCAKVVLEDVTARPAMPPHAAGNGKPPRPIVDCDAPSLCARPTKRRFPLGSFGKRGGSLVVPTMIAAPVR